MEARLCFIGHGLVENGDTIEPSLGGGPQAIALVPTRATALPASSRNCVP
jgi:hypothetical protein